MDSFQMNQEWFGQQEIHDHVRMTWNRLPSSDVAFTECNPPLPVAALYTPFTQQAVPLKSYGEYHVCSCGAIFNKHCNYTEHDWQCNFCFKLNPLHAPPDKPVLLNSTEEYQMGENQSCPSTLTFVIDTCTSPIELGFLVDKLQRTISQLPSQTLVSIITIADKSVLVHQLAGDNLPPIVFGVNDESAEQVAYKLKLCEKIYCYMQPVSSCISELLLLLSRLKATPPTDKMKRVSRPTGKALSVAVSIMEKAISYNPQGRILLFMSGPCTDGSGQVINDNTKQLMRTCKDVKEKKAYYLKSASDYYQKVATRALENGYVIDLFNSGITDAGLYEMSCCAEKTGGLFASDTTFASISFEMNLVAAMLNQPITGKITSFRVKTSDGLKLRNIDNDSRLILNATRAIYFDVLKGKREGFGFIQFVTTYDNRIRVTTICRQWIDPIMHHFSYINGLDPMAGGIITARLALSEQDPSSWLTKMWSEWQKSQRKYGSAQFGQLPHVTTYQHIINLLRESPLLSTNSTGSVDETILMRLTFNRLNVNESMWMIHPRRGSLLSPDNPHHLSILDLYYRVIVHHDFPAEEIPAVEQYVMNALNLSSRVPIPAITTYYQQP